MYNFKIGLQLYSVRENLGKNLEKTLDEVKSMGYDYVETAGYYNKDAKTFKSILSNAGLKCACAHISYSALKENAEKEISFLKELGARHIAIPAIAAEEHAGNDAFKKTVEQVTKIGEYCLANDFTLLYHNHAFELEKFDGEYKLDALFKNVDSKLLAAEIDTCWLKYAGVDPSDYIKKYIGRCPIVHLKDFKFLPNTAQNTNKPYEFCVLGQGELNFKEVLAAAKIAETEYLIVEQDNAGNIPTIDSVRKSRQFLKENFNV